MSRFAFHPARAFAAAVALVLFAPAPVRADDLLLKDGRKFSVPRIVEHDDVLEIVYPHGSVEVPRSRVKEHVAGSDLEFTPANEEEAEKAAKGLVPFEGDWIPKTKRDSIVTKRRDAARERYEEAKKHQDWRDRYIDETDHFRFEYTVPLEVGQDCAEMFEAYFDVFSKEWKIRQEKGERLKVCFYNSADDFHRIGNIQRGVLGYFRFVEPIELNFFYERRDKRLTLDVLFHELNHYLFYLYTEQNYQFAPWIEEGMAEYYGASEWDAKTKTFRVGLQQEGRLISLVDAMDGGEMQDLEALMRTPDIDALQYAWSWTFCHMLMEDAKYRAKFKKYVDKIGRGKMPREPNPRNMSFQWVKPDAAIEEFQKSMGIKDLEAFEQQWYEYIRSMKVGSARGYHDAGVFCMRWNRPLRAASYFKKSIDDFYSDNPDTYLEYARILLSEDKAAEAIQVLEKGIELDPMDPYLRRELGHAHRRKGGEADKLLGKNLQLLAVEMDPLDVGLLSGLDSEVLAEVAE